MQKKIVRFQSEPSAGHGQAPSGNASEQAVRMRKKVIRFVSELFEANRPRAHFYAKLEREWLENGTPPEWGEWDTPLHRYASPLAMDFPAYVASRKGHFLDIGMGSGTAWEAIGMFPNIRFVGTVLTKEFVVPSLRKMAVECDAAGLASHFPECSFETIVSRCGMHLEEARGIDAVHRLLSPGGEAIVVGWEDSMEPAVEAAVSRGLFSKLYRASGDWVAYRLRKN